MLNTILEILILLCDECDPVMLERYCLVNMYMYMYNVQSCMCVFMYV